MDIGKKVEEFRARLQFLEATGAEDIVWVALDKDVDTAGILGFLYPGLHIFAAECESPQEFLVEMEAYLKDSTKEVTLKEAKAASSEMGLKVGI